MAEISLEMLQSLLKQLLAEQLETRKDLKQMRNLLLGLVDQNRRIERRITDTKDDLEIMLRAEIMGRGAIAERDMGARVDALEARLSTIEAIISSP